MKMKKMFSALCTAAVLMSSLVCGLPSAALGIVHAEEAEEATPPAVPQNLRYEDGFILWDEVEDAYGYTLRTYVDDNEREYTYYVTSVELDRLCYENNMDFGEYRFEVCAFDESRNRSEWSEPVNASYAATLETPANVRLSEDGEKILWDAVDGAARYNLRVYKEDADWLLNTWITECEITVEHWLHTTGNYLFLLQAMDKDYNISQWTEPIVVPYTAAIVDHLEAPKNVQLDESGENIIWDEVEGADDYSVRISTFIDEENGWLNDSGSTTQPMLSNWKTNTWPFFSGEYEICVWAYSNEGLSSSNNSNILKVSVAPVCDESIGLPESVRIEDNCVKWDDVEGAAKYLLCLSANGEPLRDEWHRVYAEYNGGVYIGNRLPEGTYEAELYVVDENNKYNSKTYSLTLNTVHDETTWVPELYYKFDTLLWDYDRVRHDNTNFFWIRLTKEGKVVKLIKSWSEYFDGLSKIDNGDYIVDACVLEDSYNLGEWSKPLEITKHDGGLFDKENEYTEEIVPPPEAEEIPEEDRITSITINPAFNMKHKDGDDVELDLTKIKIKANEIYDEEGLKRAEEALGETIKGNTHYNLLDLTLLYDGEDFSNGYNGLVQVIIPLPKGHRDKIFSCYRLTEVDGKTVKEVIPGEQTEDSYIIYLEHFSEYALVGEGDHTHSYGEAWKTDEDSHWKECECGEKTEEAAHTYGDWITTKEATETEEGSRERSCTVCGYKQTENLPKLTPSAPPADEKKPMEFKDSGTKIEITAPADTFDHVGDITFNAVPVAEQTRDNQFAFDLSFTDKEGRKVQPKAAVTVKIPVPASLKGRTVFAYHVENNGTYAEIDCRIENDMAVFTASNFSIYILADEKLNTDGTDDEPEETDEPDVSPAPGAYIKSPDTNDYPVTGIAALSFLTIAIAIVTAGLSKKRK